MGEYDGLSRDRESRHEVLESAKKEHKPDYIKVIAAEESDLLSRTLYSVDWGEHYEFGQFRRAIDISKYCRVFRFDPLSHDVLPADGRKYDNRQEALNAAIKYLNSQGFHAKTFDLVGLVDRIEVKN